MGSIIVAQSTLNYKVKYKSFLHRCQVFRNFFLIGGQWPQRYSPFGQCKCLIHRDEKASLFWYKELSKKDL